MKRFLTLIFAVMATGALLTAAEPADGVRQAGAGWRQGAITQDKALLQRYLADDMITRTAAARARARRNISRT